MAVAQLATILAKLSRQEYQYIALLKQVADLTEHESTCPDKQWFDPEFEYSDEMSKDIFDYVQRWLGMIIEQANAIENVRNKALDDLRKVDVLDNESLKKAALQLTEAESQCTIIQGVKTRWSKIVRHEESSDLQKHTTTWLKRWLAQWKKNHSTIQQRSIQFQESLKAPFLHT